MPGSPPLFLQGMMPGPPGAGNRLTAAHICIALSQSKGHEELMMMRPLTDALKKVLSNHISEALMGG